MLYAKLLMTRRLAGCKQNIMGTLVRLDVFLHYTERKYPSTVAYMADNARGYRESLMNVLQKWGNSRAGMSGSLKMARWLGRSVLENCAIGINKVGAPGFGGTTSNKCRSGCRCR